MNKCDWMIYFKYLKNLKLSEIPLWLNNILRFYLIHNSSVENYFNRFWSSTFWIFRLKKKLTLQMLRSQYSRRTRSIFLMSWFPASPGHQHPWYWLREMRMLLSSLKISITNLCCLIEEDWYWMQIYTHIVLKKICKVHNVINHNLYWGQHLIKTLFLNNSFVHYYNFMHLSARNLWPYVSLSFIMINNSANPN